MSSCKPKVKNTPPSDWIQKVNIYMGGELGDSVTYWKNGKPISLNRNGLFANAATVFHSDIYLAGSLAIKDTLTDHIHTRAVYCKNGQVSFLTNGRNSATATGISVSGPDVYVSGYEYSGDTTEASGDHRKSIAKYWKNGIQVILTDGHVDARATAIAIDGSDVYVAGYEKNEISVARCWKNGQLMTLKIDSNISHNANYSEAYSIFIAGKDVYIAGTECGLAVYWKNGIPVLLVPGQYPSRTGLDSDNEDSKATSIAVSGKDVHVAGIQDTLASMFHTVKYWKNGKAVTLSRKPFDAKTNAFLALNNNDVYITCTLADPKFNYHTTVWKNTIPVVFSKETIRVTSIFVNNK